jgi:hypothetical protein
MMVETNMTNAKFQLRAWQLTSRLALLCLALPVVLTGCGGTNSPVTGTVTFNGSPVEGGTLVFSPMGTGGDSPGSPSTAEVKPDGTFKLLTIDNSTGAAPGHHRVVYTPPEPKMTEEQRTNPKYQAPVSPYAGLQPKQVEVEVKSGSNTIDIELVKAPRKPN